MSTPNIETQKLTFKEQVNEVVGKMTTNDNGAWQLPEVEMSESVEYAARVEKRRRDTEGAYTKATQRANKAEAMVSTLKKQVSPATQFTEAQNDELDELKESDPDLWHRTLQRFETEAQTALDEEVAESALEAEAEGIVKFRVDTLNEFNQEHEGAELTEEQLDNDIPPRLSKQLESGKLPFKDFLYQAHAYINSSKKVASGNTKVEPNLGKMPGKDGKAIVTEAVDYEGTSF